MIKIYDVECEESQYTKEKFREKYDSLDMNTWNCFNNRLVTTSLVKHMYRYNYYGV